MHANTKNNEKTIRSTNPGTIIPLVHQWIRIETPLAQTIHVLGAKWTGHDVAGGVDGNETATGEDWPDNSRTKPTDEKHGVIVRCVGHDLRTTPKGAVHRVQNGNGVSVAKSKGVSISRTILPAPIPHMQVTWTVPANHKRQCLRHTQSAGQ